MEQIIVAIEEEIKRLNELKESDITLESEITSTTFTDSDTIRNYPPQKIIPIMMKTYCGENVDLTQINANLKVIDFDTNGQVIFYLLMNMKKMDPKYFEKVKKYLKKVDDPSLFKSIKSLLHFLNEPQEEVVHYTIQFLDAIQKSKISHTEIIALLNIYLELPLEPRTTLVDYIAHYQYAHINKEDDYTIQGPENYLEMTSQIVRYAEEVMRKNKNQKRSRFRQLADLETLKKLMEKYSNTDYIFLPNEYINSLNIDFICKLNEFITNHNEQIYKELINRITKISNLDLNSILHKNNIPNHFNKKEKQLLEEYISLGTIEKIIDQAKKIFTENHYENETLINILINTNEENIELITKAIDFHYISLEALKKQFAFFYKSNNSILKQNIEIARIKKIKEINLGNLLLDSNFTSLIELCELYGLNIQDEYVIQNMTKPHFFDYLDLLIELGFYQEIVKDTTILSENLENIIKRVKLANALHLNITDKSIITGTNFPIPDNLLDQYVFSIVPTKLESEKVEVLNNSSRLHYIQCPELDNEYFLSDYEYIIKGIIIARPKVMRNSAVLEDKEICIFHNSILNEEQYMKIREELSKKSFSRNLIK